MEYLAYFRPSEEIGEELESFREELVRSRKEDLYTFPSAGLHCTLFRVEAAEEREERILKKLEIIRKEFAQEGLVAIARELDLFAKSSLVLKLERTEALYALHTGIFVSFLPYIDKSSEYGAKELLAYFGKNYAPHVSLVRFRTPDYVPEEWMLERERFGGREWPVKDFYLVKADKKEGEEWREVDGWR